MNTHLWKRRRRTERFLRIELQLMRTAAYRFFSCTYADMQKKIKNCTLYTVIKSFPNKNIFTKKKKEEEVKVSFNFLCCALLMLCTLCVMRSGFEISGRTGGFDIAGI